VLASVAAGVVTVACRKPTRTSPTKPGRPNSTPAAPSVAPQRSPKPVFFEHLEPDQPFFDGNYYQPLRESLLDEYPERECQMISLPPFGTESATFVACKKGSLSVVLRQSPAGMLRSDEKNGRAVRSDHHLVERIKRMTREYSAPISRETVDLLRLVWTSMLSTVPASAPSSLGPDTAGYLFAHGGRSGCTWSPPRSSPCGRLVATAAAMSELASDAPLQTEHKVVALATDLLARIPRIVEAQPNRTCP